MKKLISLITAAFFLLQLNAQQSKVSFSLYKKMHDEKNQNKQAALFVKGNVSEIKTLTQNLGGYFKYSAGDVAAIQIPVSKAWLLAASESVKRIEDNTLKLELMNDSMRIKNNVNPVHAGQAPLPKGYSGKDVVMGILDTGIDFTHPDFNDSTGGTRILYIWDHYITDPNGITPQPYNYGTEYSKAVIDAGNAFAHYDTFYFYSHGTHVAGVAAGNGNYNWNYRGVAYESDLVIVALNFLDLDENDWLTSVADGVQYCYDKAASLGKPCVINISAGNYFGSHDAKDLQAQLIENLISAQNGRALVCSAGNIGFYPFHTQHNIAAGDTSFTWVTYNSQFGPTIYNDIWADTSDFNNVKLSFGSDKKIPNFEFRGALPFRTISYFLNQIHNDTIYSVSGSKLAVVQTFGELIDDRYRIQVSIAIDSAYNFRISSTGIGMFDMWGYTFATGANVPNAATFPPIVNYVHPDLNQNIVSSFTCSDKVITVGETGNRVGYTTCNASTYTNPGIHPNNLDAESSHGPTRDGRIKPEIAASGGITLAPSRLDFPALIPSQYDTTCYYKRDGGTSTSSPVVAGIVALLLERYPNANWQDIKACITSTALIDSFVTGTLPNNSWGYGKVDGFAALSGCNFLSALFPENETAEAIAFPNPFTNETTIRYRISESEKYAALEVFNSIGTLVRMYPLNNLKGEVKIKDGISSGIYIFKITSGKKILKTGKLVKL